MSRSPVRQRRTGTRSAEGGGPDIDNSKPEAKTSDNRGRAYPGEVPLLLSLGCGLVCAVLIDGNVNRLNFLWLPLLWFCAVGLHALLARLGNWAALPVLGLLVCCCVFCSSYVRSLGGRGNVNFFPGLEESLRFADTLDAETVYITPTVNQPYIFALFYERVPPDTFVRSVEYRDESAAFRDVLRFEGYEFADPTRADVQIVWRGYEEEGEVLARFGCFAVCGMSG